MANSGIIDSSGKGFRLTTQTVSALLLIAAVSVVCPSCSDSA